ncbi:MAG: HmuY family protein [Melioribacter sp.]|nr:HmuY family protein [Melioribacter sp.]
MNKHILFYIMLIVFVISCKESNTTEPEDTPSQTKVTLVKDLPANGPGLTYFRFSDSTIVTGEDTLTNKWDIAFRKTTIYTNSGVKGPGKGGAIVLTNTDFYELSEAPAEGYKIEENNTPAIPTGSGKGWYNYNSQTHIITPIPGVVLVIRTAEGKYAKMQIISYYKGAPENPSATNISGYYTFKYVYQKNGSRRFN